MIKNYLRVALRSLQKQKFFSLVNIIGLAMGMACYAIFALTPLIKLHADQFHRAADRIYALVQVIPDETGEQRHTAFTPAPLLSALREEIPEIENGARVLPADHVIVQLGDDSFYENKILFADPAFLSMFSFPLRSGHPAEALRHPNSIVLSATLAAKYFGDEDPLGQVITLNRQVDLVVTGIMEDVPRTSSLSFQALIPLETAFHVGHDPGAWGDIAYTTFVLLPPENDAASVDQKLTNLLHKYYPENPRSPDRMYLFPLLDFRLHSRHIASIMSSSTMTSVIIVLALGSVLLLVVCINFINLSTARHMQRMKEIGMRKVVGASRWNLIQQFLGESLLLALLAAPLAVLLFELVYPWFINYLGPLPIIPTVARSSNSIWNYPFLLKYILATAIGVGLFSGLYPAIYLSSFHPGKALTGRALAARKKHIGSKILIVTQFVLSVVFIAAASLFEDQCAHLLQADYGYDKQHIIALDVDGVEVQDRTLLRDEIARRPEVEMISAADEVPVFWMSPGSMRPADSQPEDALTAEVYGVDYGFLELMGIELNQGRSFSEERGDQESLIINRAAAQRLPWDNPVGRQLTVDGRRGTIIGVTDDFLFSDIEFEIPSSVLFLDTDKPGSLLIKYTPTAEPRYLTQELEKLWGEILPGIPFQAVTLEHYHEDTLSLIKKTGGLLNYVGLLAVFLSSLGLLGLASSLAERRTREMGIRKVLGAPFSHMIWTLMKQFIILVIIADTIGIAIVYFGWQSVLQTGLLFLEGIRLETFLLVIGISLVAAVLAVGSQILKTARLNPIDILRYE